MSCQGATLQQNSEVGRDLDEYLGSAELREVFYQASLGSRLVSLYQARRPSVAEIVFFIQKVLRERTRIQGVKAMAFQVKPRFEAGLAASLLISNMSMQLCM